MKKKSSKDVDAKEEEPSASGASSEAGRWQRSDSSDGSERLSIRSTAYERLRQTCREEEGRRLESAEWKREKSGGYAARRFLLYFKLRARGKNKNTDL